MLLLQCRVCDVRAVPAVRFLESMAGKVVCSLPPGHLPGKMKGG